VKVLKCPSAQVFEGAGAKVRTREVDMKVERFEGLICWQKARKLANAIYEPTRQPAFAKDYELVRQIRGASLSSMSNIAEGFDRWSRKELVRFLGIARGSAGEVRSQLYLALDQKYISAEQFEVAKSSVLEISNTVSGLIGYLEGASPACKGRETTDDSAPVAELPDEYAVSART
jgi:four helix bundle protein